MDLIGNDLNTMPQANLANLLQLFLCPDPADGVVGTAENKEFDIIFYNFCLKVSKIDGLMAAFIQ